MCRAVPCRQCGKIGWKGCGMHVDQVLSAVPRDQRCPGHAKEPGALRRLFARS